MLCLVQQLVLAIDQPQRDLGPPVVEIGAEDREERDEDAD
jgi:hypothetical protein